MSSTSWGVPNLTTSPAIATADHEPTLPAVRWTLARQILAVSLLVPITSLLVLFGLGPLQIPPVAALVAIQVVCAAFFLWRGSKWAALVGGIALFLLAALNIPFLGPAALRPDHGKLFIGANVIILNGPIGLAAGIAAFREARATAWRPAHWGAPGAIAVAVAAGLIGGVAFAGMMMHGAPVQGAAVALTPDATHAITISEFAFPTVTIPADQIVRITITNEDADPHTFTVPDLDINAELPGGKSVDVWVKAPAGTYFLYCAPHSGGTADDGTGMVGELVVQ